MQASSELGWICFNIAAAFFSWQFKMEISIYVFRKSIVLHTETNHHYLFISHFWTILYVCVHNLHSWPLRLLRNQYGHHDLWLLKANEPGGMLKMFTFADTDGLQVSLDLTSNLHTNKT